MSAPGVDQEPSEGVGPYRAEGLQGAARVCTPAAGGRGSARPEGEEAEGQVLVHYLA